MDELTTLARAQGPHGEVALRRRLEPDGTAVEELVVDGVFAMDSRETASERRLGELVAEDDRLRRVAVGGLGLGFTAETLLAAGVGHLDVVELEPALVDWARSGLTPRLGRVAADPRCRLLVADLADWLAATPPGGYDAVLLDVDNGPDFLVHPHNAALYSPALLALAHGLLVPGGLLAVWCQQTSPVLAGRLARLGPTTEELVGVRRGRHRIDYALYATTRGQAGSQGGGTGEAGEGGEGGGTRGPTGS